MRWILRFTRTPRRPRRRRARAGTPDAPVERVLSRDALAGRRLLSRQSLNLQPCVNGIVGRYVRELDWSQRMEVYRDWMRRHPESREAWECARFGGPLPRA